MPAYLVSHSATCSHAGEFSKAKGERQRALDALIEAAGAIAQRATKGEQLELDARPPEKLVADLMAAFIAVSVN